MKVCRGPGRHVEVPPEGHRFDLLEELVVTDKAIRSECGPQVVQQGGDESIEHGSVAAQAFVGDGHGQVGLARPMGAGKHHPALRCGGVGLSILPSELQAGPFHIRGALPTPGVEVGEGHPPPHLFGHVTHCAALLPISSIPPAASALSKRGVGVPRDDYYLIMTESVWVAAPCWSTSALPRSRSGRSLNEHNGACTPHSKARICRSEPAPIITAGASEAYKAPPPFPSCQGPRPEP